MLFCLFSAIVGVFGNFGCTLKKRRKSTTKWSSPKYDTWMETSFDVEYSTVGFVHFYEILQISHVVRSAKSEINYVRRSLSSKGIIIIDLISRTNIIFKTSYSVSYVSRRMHPIIMNSICV